jgi:Predicted membrane protein (DUF2127)
VEGAGLWLGRRWGEYFALVATSIFLPYEVYELTEKPTWLRVTALVINLLLVIYLAWTKRLFGIRGGKKSYDARLRTESVIEVEQAALTAASPGQPSPGQPAGAAARPAGDAPDSPQTPSRAISPRLTPPQTPAWEAHAESTSGRRPIWPCYWSFSSRSPLWLSTRSCST